MQHAKERPDVRSRDRLPLDIADDSPQFTAILDDLVRDKTFRRKPALKLCAVAGRAGAVEKTHEMLEEALGATLRNKNQAVIRRSEPVSCLEVTPEILDCLFAVIICCADGESALHLAGEFLRLSSEAFTDNQKVVGLPPEVLCLEVDLQHGGIDQDRRNAPHEQMGEPVRRDVLLEKCALPPRSDGS